MRRTPLRVGIVTLGGLALAAGPLATPATAAPVEIQILTINDFHGRLEANTRAGIPGAAVLAGAVDAISAEKPSALVAAGDNIGATPFISAVAEDRPTIDVLNAMGLRAASAIGNHEFDRGYAFLSDPAKHGIDGNGLAKWPTLGANVEGENPDLAASTVADIGGVKVGFVGVVTEQTPSLVAAGGIPGISFTDPVDAANGEADRLTDEGLADTVVLLAHEGASVSADTPAACVEMMNRNDAFGAVVRGANENVDAIVGGHTNVKLDCDLPYTLGGSATRPVIEAVNYGMFLGRIQLTIDPVTDVIASSVGDVLPVQAGTYPADECVTDIVAAAKAESDVLGAVPVGEIADDIDGFADRTSESRAGNFIADVQLDATSTPELGSAQIAFMNPGGVRADFLFEASGDEGDGIVTYGEAATVQPFSNGVITMTLSGAQVKEVLEQQYQTNAAGDPIPSAEAQAFLALGVSDGFEYTFDNSQAQGNRITSITLNGAPLDPEDDYRVTVNSFLATGGDNFRTLGEGTERQDNGFNDLNVLVDYFEANSPITQEQIDDLTPRRFGPAAPGAEEPDGESTMTVDSITGAAPRLARTPVATAVQAGPVMAAPLPASCDETTLPPGEGTPPPGGGTPPPGGGGGDVDDKDCADFATQAEAQAALADGDPFNLDSDNDGIACESGVGRAGAGGGGAGAGQNRGLSVDTGRTDAGTDAGTWALTGLLLTLTAGGAVAFRRRGAVR